MADSAKFTVTDSTGSYLTLEGLSIADTVPLYIKIRFFLPTATEADWIGPPDYLQFSPAILDIRETNLSGANIDFVRFYTDTYTEYNYYDDWWDGIFDNPALATVAGQWHNLEWTRETTNSPGPLTIKIDGATEDTNAAASIKTVGAIAFGVRDAFTDGFPTSTDFYIAHIQVGTTLGGSDVLDWVAAGVADFSAFSNTVGTVVLADAPVPPDETSPTGEQPEGVSIAFNDATLEPAPVWTRIDN